jgi:hypothetical protein
MSASGINPIASRLMSGLNIAMNIHMFLSVLGSPRPAAPL